MARHISPAEVKEFVRLYEMYGSYQAVAVKMRRSASAVSKHIKLYYAANLSAMTQNAAPQPQQTEVKQIIINL